MSEEIIKLFEVNTDAIATNRGFYYQYLVTLKKWIVNYIDNTGIITSIEVEDDIKEVGDEIIFTQVKCYTSSFSFQSKEIIKSLFNFFILYLKYKHLNQNISFSFSTNSKISKSEILLNKWSNTSLSIDKNLKKSCINKVKGILIKEIKDKKNRILQKGTEKTDKLKVKRVSSEFINSLTNNNLEPFVTNIHWKFEDQSTEASVGQLTKEIYHLLKNDIFEGKPNELLFKVLISEIYKNSQKKEIHERVLDDTTLRRVVKFTDLELNQLVENKLTNLFRIEFDLLKADINQLRQITSSQSEDIENLKKDKTQIDFPKYMNLIPDFSSIEVYGRDTFTSKIRSNLEKKNILAVYSEGGTGKTTFGKKYLKETFENYKHIVWINIEESLSTSLVLDEVLRKNLNISKTSKIDSITLAYEYMLNELNKIGGKNLIILDIQKSENELSEINSIFLSPNWHKLILTRSNLSTIPSIKLPILKFKYAKKFYLSHLSQNSTADDNLLRKFFEIVDYNLLVIELVAKTIDNSIDLSLSDFTEAIVKQELDQKKYHVEIDVNDRNNPIIIFNYILQKFALPFLESKEILYLEFLSILPSSNIVIEELILINGLNDYSENKIYITNVLNSLNKKGLITISKDRKRLDIHKVVRETIIYSQRKMMSPFITSVLFITWLTARLKEGYNSPKTSFRYLKYAKSIVNSIKEDYRGSVYQPLLLLENELLYAQRFYLGSKSNLSSLIDLADRASKYLSLDKGNLGVIYNNLGMGYAEKGNNGKAITFFKKALNEFANNKKQPLSLTITTLNNLSGVFLKERKIIKAMKYFEKVQNIRKEHSLYDDQQLSVEFSILSESYAITGLFDQAISLLVSGIEKHRSLDKASRNDFYLATYHKELSYLYLISDQIEKAVKNQEIAMELLENMGMDNSEHLLVMYKVSKRLYNYLDQESKEKEMDKKISSFKVYQS